jgi:two-component system, OmpR family, sensor histidine kinase BaeS
MRRRQRLAQRRQRVLQRGGRWRLQQGFGCLAGILFLVVLGSIVTATASLLSTLGPVPAVIAVVVAILVAAALVRGILGAARDLDSVLGAVRRVQSGDYTVRLNRMQSDLAPIEELGRGFDTMVARLEADETQREALLADLGHELRTPLSVITANLEGIIDGIYPPDEAHLAPILDEARVLERLIDDLRTITLTDAGTLPMHPEPTDAETLVGDVVRSFAAAATTAGITLTTTSEPGLPAIDLDPVRTREVLVNLVGNALRHTPPGGSVAVGASGTSAGVLFTVRDTGPGIDPELLPHVFDRFVTGAGPHGSGLGLAIARGLVEAQGGTIAVVSPAGGGTTFRVTLPRGASLEV